MATYDPAKCRELLKIVPAYAQHPLAEMVRELAEQLEAAEFEIRTSAATAHNATKERDSLASQLETANSNVRRLRDGNSGNSEMLLALQMIAKSSRGAQKLAQETVAKVTAAEVVKV